MKIRFENDDGQWICSYHTKDSFGTLIMTTLEELFNKGSK